MEVGNQFNNRSPLSSTELMIANLINVIANAASFTFLLLFLAILVLHKAWKTTLQRLFLCLTIATALNAMVTSFNIELQFEFNHKSELKFCAWIGFFNAWTSNLIELFSLAFTVHLIIITYQSFKGHAISCLNSCRKHPVLTEMISIWIITFFPLSYLIKLLHSQVYGLSGTLCWINVTCSDEESYQSGKDNLLLSMIRLFLHSIVTLSFAILIIVISIKTVKVQYLKEESLGTIRKAVFLIAVIVIILCIRTAQFGVYMNINFHRGTAKECRYIAFDNTLYSLTNLMVPLGFAVYLYSPKKLSLKSLLKAAKQWGCFKKLLIYCRRKRNNIGEDELVGIQRPILQEIPSHTTCLHPSYTNAFTDITENVSMSSPKYGTLHKHD